MKNIKQILLAVLLSSISSISFADEYRIDISGQITANYYSSSIFGIPYGETAQVSGTITVDSALGSIVEYPAGTVFNSQNGQALISASTKFSQESIKSFTLTIGNRTFSQVDIQDSTLVDLGLFALLVESPLVNPVPASFIMTVDDMTTVASSMGYTLCDMTACHVVPEGNAYEYDTGNSGSIINVTAVITPLTVNQKDVILDALSDLEGLSEEFAVKKSLARFLDKTITKVAESEEIREKKIIRRLEKFTDKINGKAGKNLTPEQKQELLNAVDNVLDAL